MKQVNSFRYWLATLLLLCVGMTAQAYDLTKTATAEDHGTITFKVNGTAVTSANENDKVTIEIAPKANGWQVDQVTATRYTSWNVAGARGEMPTTADLIKVQPVTGSAIYVVVMADNNYESMYAVSQVIVKPVEIVEADVTEGEANANGLPNYTVKKFGRTLEEGVDYTLEFFDKDEVKQTAAYVVSHPGDYMAVLTFGGNYYGIVEKKFKATGLPISVANFTNVLLTADNPNEPVNAENAKYNFNGDEFINIADLQALMNLQLGLTVEGDPISSGSRASVNVAEDAVMNISTSDLGGGVTRYSLSLEGDRQFSAFLMDVVTTGSAMIISEQAAEGMQLYSKTLGSTLRIIGLAEGSAAEGSVLQIDVMGNGSVSFGNISFSTPDATTFNVRMGDATGISLTNAASAEGNIFGLGGQRQETLQKGVNIVRQNGKAVKVIRK